MCIRDSGHNGVEVTDDAVVALLEDERGLVRVDGHDDSGVPHTDHVLQLSGDPDRHIQLWCDLLPGDPDVAFLGDPVHALGQGPGAGELAADGVGKAGDQSQVGLRLAVSYTHLTLPTILR